MDALADAVPLFRSRAQFVLLGELFTDPAERTIGELAERTAVPQATVSREIGRLVEAGLVRSRREGNRTIIAAALDTSLSGDLRSLLMKLYGPLREIETAFHGLDVEFVAVYGSWAARWHGQPGPPPNDLDLLVVGEAEVEHVLDVVAELSRVIGLEVNPLIRRSGSWASDDGPFATEVRSRPQVIVIDRRDEERP